MAEVLPYNEIIAACDQEEHSNASFKSSEKDYWRTTISVMEEERFYLERDSPTCEDAQIWISKIVVKEYSAKRIARRFSEGNVVLGYQRRWVIIKRLKDTKEIFNGFFNNGIKLVRDLCIQKVLQPFGIYCGMAGCELNILTQIGRHPNITSIKGFTAPKDLIGDSAVVYLEYCERGMPIMTWDPIFHHDIIPPNVLLAKPSNHDAVYPTVKLGELKLGQVKIEDLPELDWEFVPPGGQTDTLILDGLRKLKKRVLKKTAKRKSKLRPRFEKALLKCILTMSDLQILTGLSILISGFTQLRCGLSVYHWQIIVRLAWFCSLTHLACLTFLRNHLHGHRGERKWRLLAMGILVLLLIGALLPTGKYGISTFAADYAICSYKQLKMAKPKNGSTDSSNAELGYASMIISILFVALGFLSRITRLHRSISNPMTTAPRKFLSKFLRKRLCVLYEKFKSSPFKRLLIYRPALACFLTIRAPLDLWSSLFLEVWWLIASFAWGVYNLVVSWKDHPGSLKSNKGWTFGQVMPVILLFAPVLSIAECLLEKPPTSAIATAQSEDDVEEPPTPTSIAEVGLPQGSQEVHDEPDHDFYLDAWFRFVVVLLLFGVIISTTTVLFVPFNLVNYGFLKKPKKGEQFLWLVPNGYFINWVPCMFLLASMNMILFSLLFKDWECRGLNWKKLNGIVLPALWVVSLALYFFFGYWLLGAYIFSVPVLFFLYVLRYFAET
ncbi:hypothetical protein BDV96DRAFT_598361 [Lophiotrema nucula]|uniref:Protein kinase domain-containing protein n=1 Tax=Lophiotrema nucula TaxID=690887 RepID=A0A6A5ZEH4_9PLEO|nr:hypothetical protein BDV96DRAFT_598361 [Lophiotrema nucula]